MKVEKTWLVSENVAHKKKMRQHDRRRRRNGILSKECIKTNFLQLNYNTMRTYKKHFLRATTSWAVYFCENWHSLWHPRSCPVAVLYGNESEKRGHNDICRCSTLSTKTLSKLPVSPSEMPLGRSVISYSEVFLKRTMREVFLKHDHSLPTTVAFSTFNVSVVRTGAHVRQP